MLFVDFTYMQSACPYSSRVYGALLHEILTAFIYNTLADQLIASGLHVKWQPQLVWETLNQFDYYYNCYNEV